MGKAKMKTVDIGMLIQSRPGVNGGRPCLAGTGLSVLQIAVFVREGLTPEQILNEYPHLDLARVYAGVTYYLANKAALDEQLETEEREFYEAAARHGEHRVSA
jgi:uncharacterized protein (DUF433 family)